MAQFDQFLPKFLTDFVKWNFGKKHVCCRVGISEKFIAVFNLKMSQTGTENDK